MKRMNRIFRGDGKTVIVPMDHGVTLGPVAGLTDMQETINKIIDGGADAIVVHKGIASKVNTGTTGLIVHLSASTTLAPDPNRKVLVCSAEEALRIGADAISVHINVGAETEPEMLSDLGTIADTCDEFCVPLLAMMYPRGPKITDGHDPELVAHAARIGAELGADIVKTNYTGDRESFTKIVKSCPVPIIIAGGPKVDTMKDFLEMISDSMKSGAAGLSIGRNVFQNKNPTLMVRALSSIVHLNATVTQALQILGA
jgi:fructose-bisphosphate aldolase/2-amino-3,7-dideoxy-D-threo-hept-6-ulosonate synthase